ncbi:peptidoglycan bridge formation glycyltransferase FemA/FemB family protein [Candidatus Nomurabacteria bacterium]|nr:peptidoglycan bridge formation glycyltransferase FemA/FemB family protein [Candidatus Nomurabacteria bacterium]
MEVLVKNTNQEVFLSARFLSGAFLQSDLWKDFLSAQQKRFWQITTWEKDELLALCLLYENKLPLGKSYLYAPKGPVFKNDLDEEMRAEALRLILSKTRDLTIETKKIEEVFLRLEASDELVSVDGLIDSESTQPKDTLFLDLKKDTKELLAAMHPKTRYNISLAIKKGVKIVVSEKEEDLKYFLELNKKTSSRQQISSHPEKYYQLLWQTLLKNRAGKLYLAYLGKEVVAVNLILNFAQTSTYLHGASDYQFRKYMAPHLLQWQAIKDAQSAGMLYYDFWGVAPKDGSKPKWEGFTRFKEGFGGQRISAPRAKIFVYQENLYQAYQFFKKLKKFLRF